MSDEPKPDTAAELKKMPDDDLLLQINRFDPYDVEFARRFRAVSAERDRLRAERDAAFAAGVEAAATVADEYANMDYCAMNYPEEAGMAASSTAYEVAVAIRAITTKGGAE